MLNQIPFFGRFSETRQFGSDFAIQLAARASARRCCRRKGRYCSAALANSLSISLIENRRRKIRDKLP
jgi:hypothetical protein